MAILVLVSWLKSLRSAGLCVAKTTPIPHPPQSGEFVYHGLHNLFVEVLPGALLREVVMGLVDGHGRKARRLSPAPHPAPQTAYSTLYTTADGASLFSLPCLVVLRLFSRLFPRRVCLRPFCAFVFVDYVCKIRRVSRPCSCPRTRH
jgi:hypothetical protein